MTKPQKRSLDEQQDLDSRLADAAKRGDTGMAQTLLAKGANVHSDTDVALCFACEHGHTETVTMLLAAGADIHAREDDALRWAACCGHTETVKALLANGADVHADHDYALRRAVFYGHTETVQVLAAHIFAPDSWRVKSRVEIEDQAKALYSKIEADNPRPERLRKAATIFANSAIDCWHQVRPAPPKLKISPLPARPRPV